jgi:hypothetical protein
MDELGMTRFRDRKGEVLSPAGRKNGRSMSAN